MKKHLRSFDNAGSSGTFYLFLIGVFSLNNVIVTLQYYGEEIKEYSFDDYENGKEISTLHPTSVHSWYETINYGIIRLISKFMDTRDVNWKSFSLNSVFNCGFLFGSFIFGIWGDLYGRKVTLILSNLISIIGSMLLIFTSSFLMRATGHFYIGFSLNANATMMYILAMEYVKINHRTFFVNVIAAIVCSLAGGVAPWLLSFTCCSKHYMIIISFLQIFAVLFYLNLTDSYQWFMAFGNTDDAISELTKVAAYNGRELKHEVIDYVRTYENVDNHECKNYKSLFVLLKSNKIKLTILLCFLKSFFLAFGLGIMFEKLKFHGYSTLVTTLLLAATNLPAAGFATFIDSHGRRATSVLLTFTSSLFITFFSLIFAPVNDDVRLMIVILFTIIGIKAVILINTQHTCEVLPTKLRAQGLCGVNVIGFFGYRFALYCYSTQNMIHSLSGVIAGASISIASLISMFLPETQHKLMPITLSEAEDIEDSNDLYLHPLEEDDIFTNINLSIIEERTRLPIERQDH